MVFICQTPSPAACLLPNDTHQYHRFADEDEDYQDNENEGDAQKACDKYVGLSFVLLGDFSLLYVAL